MPKARDMPLTNTVWSAILADTSKRVLGDIDWSDAEHHSPTQQFHAKIDSSAGWPLFVKGSYNPFAMTLSYAIILKTTGRIYALDLGKDHHNPQCNRVGEKHKHKWSKQYRDKEAYVPEDITAPASRPVEVWQQFCAEACLEHDGTLAHPRELEGEFP